MTDAFEALPPAVRIISVGEGQYYVHPKPIRLPSFGLQARQDGQPVPCTVINWSQSRFDDNNLGVIASRFASRDGVWTTDFLGVVILRAPKAVKVEVEKQRVSVVTEPSSAQPPNGPYIIQSGTGDIFAVSRLFEDTHCAFIGGSVRSIPGTSSWEWLHIQKYIAVPSRLYDEPTPERPLAGLRFGVKDIVDVEGLETGCGNRGYRKVYPKRTSTAPCVQRLIDAGAVFVGKLKTTQFAEGETPIQWFDYLAPFNPRGDGYQVPSSSSTGSAVASAAYTWLDFTIGTDTGGSIRHPAGVNGTYGLRPSLSAVSSTGVMSVSTILDTVGLFARSALILEPVLKAMADPIIPTLPLPTSSTKYKLIYPIRAKDAPPKDNLRWFPHPDQPGTEAVVEARFEEVVRSLEAHLKCKRHVINMDELWRTARPAGQPETLDAATGLIYRALTSYNSVRHNIDPFVSAHKAACGGAAPFIDPIVRARLEHGRTMTDSEYAAAVESGKIFGKWVRDVVLSPSPSSSEEEEPYPLLVFPQSFGLPVYRDEPDPSAPIFHTSFSIYSLSYLSGAPDCTVPVGEVLRRSRISQKEMWLPVSLSVVGRVGSEAGLVKLLGELERGGVIRGVEVGERMGWGECRG